MFPLYIFDYSGRQPEELLALAAQPRSSVEWRRLAKLLGYRYRHLPALGNRNYKGGPMELVDPETGVAQVADLLAHQPVILLCLRRGGALPPVAGPPRQLPIGLGWR